MCSMALLHSRAARVIFGCRCASGALQSTVRLHEMPNLNHHYSVYAGCCSKVLRVLHATRAHSTFALIAFQACEELACEGCKKPVQLPS